jgi:hypothetical protein
MAHTIIFFAVTCCGCSLVAIEDPGSEFVTRNEYQNWIAEQAFVHLRALPFLQNDDRSGRALAFWKDMALRSVDGDPLCGKLVNQLTKERWPIIDASFRNAAELDSKLASLGTLAGKRVLDRCHSLSLNDQQRGLQLVINVAMQMPKLSHYWPWESIMECIRYAWCISLVRVLIYSQRGIFSRNARKRAGQAHLLGASSSKR